MPIRYFAVGGKLARRCFLWCAFLSGCLLSCAACQDYAAVPSADSADDRKIVFDKETTKYFEHAWAFRTSKDAANSDEVITKRSPVTTLPRILVIEGDGVPWRNRFQVAGDPTSASPLLLDWLTMTRHTGLYLGRPCYFGKQEIAVPKPPVTITGILLNPRCDPYWYTFGRYSQIVVDSMVLATRELAAGQCLILLGHSGGGTLAMLMARQLSQVAAVVTLSGNLNVALWQQYHRFTPLVGSLDPSRLPPLPSQIKQVHIATENDDIVLPAWIEQEARRQQAEFQRWNVPGHQQWHHRWAKLEGLLADLIAKVSCPAQD